MASTFIFWPAADTNGRDSRRKLNGVPFTRAAPVWMKKGFLLFNFVLLLGSKGIFLYIEPHSKSLIYTIFCLLRLNCDRWKLLLCCFTTVTERLSSGVFLQCQCWCNTNVSTNNAHASLWLPYSSLSIGDSGRLNVASTLLANLICCNVGLSVLGLLCISPWSLLA